jgi:voltage-gated potassium channel
MKVHAQPSMIRSGPDRQRSLLHTNITLLIALLVLIFLMPVIPIEITLVNRLLLCVVVVSGLLAADFSRPVFRLLSGFASIVVAMTLLGLFFRQSDSMPYITFSLNTIFFVVITIALVAHVARASVVRASTLFCAVNSYLLIGLSLSLLFIILELIVPGSFELSGDPDNLFSTFLYYGFVTLTTLGYGDILPLTALARSLAAFTALFGQLYLVIIMAFLIGKYLGGKKEESVS